jgi:hypothetical protein
MQKTHVVPLIVLATLMSLAAASCGTDSAGPMEIEAEGAVAGVAWLDRNGSGERDSGDPPVRDVTIQLMARHGSAVLHTATSAADGEFVFANVPVGDYRAVVDEASVGDTLRIMRIDSADVTVAAGETATVLVGFSYPAMTIDSARLADVDTRLIVEGIALTGWNAFGDGSLHVRDSTSAIVAVQVPPTNVAAGDSVRVLGTVRIRSGQPVLQEVAVFRLRAGIEPPEPDTVTARIAQLADDGRLDAALVRLDSVVIQDTTRNAQGERVYTMEDSSGSVSMVLASNISFGPQFATAVIGTILEVTGVLVPGPVSGEWVIKPRSRTDIVVGPLSFPTLPIEEARQQPVDTRVIINGRALNAWSTFGDATVHVRDSTASVRAIQVPQANIQPGDSIQVVGTIAMLTGQPVLRFVQITIMEAGIEPPVADSLDTATAAGADAGRLDAGLVRFVDAVIQDTTRNADAELVLIASDGSGPVRIVLDKDISFNLTWPRQDGQPRYIGTIIDAAGVLVPRAIGTGEWILKPRSTADIQLRAGDTGDG